MIIIRVMGGLGNQLQQYALFRKFQSLGVKAKLDLSWFSQNAGVGGGAQKVCSFRLRRGVFGDGFRGGGAGASRESL